MSKGCGIFLESVLYFHHGSRIACKTALSVSLGCVCVFVYLFVHDQTDKSLLEADCCFAFVAQCAVWCCNRIIRPTEHRVFVCVCVCVQGYTTSLPSTHFQTGQSSVLDMYIAAQNTHLLLPLIFSLTFCKKMHKHEH